MKIDPKTLLFTEMSADDRAKVMAVTLAIVNEGKTPWPIPDWMVEWFSAGKFDERQQLLVTSTVFVQKAFQSLLLHSLESERLLKVLSDAIQGVVLRDISWITEVHIMGLADDAKEHLK